MKYIIYKTKHGGCDQELPILFPNQLAHLDVAKALKNVVGSSKIIAAGEFNSMDIEPSSFNGHSVSIGIKSRGRRDGLLVARFDYFQGLS